MINFEKRDNSMLSWPTKFMEANFNVVYRLRCSLLSFTSGKKILK